MRLTSRGIVYTDGRLRHFMEVTSPLTLLASPTELVNARKFLQEYQDGVGKGKQAWGREKEMGVWKAKQCEPVENDNGLLSSGSALTSTPFVLQQWSTRRYIPVRLL